MCASSTTGSMGSSFDKSLAHVAQAVQAQPWIVDLHAIRSQSIANQTYNHHNCERIVPGAAVVVLGTTSTKLMEESVTVPSSFTRCSVKGLRFAVIHAMLVLALNICS